MIRGAWALSTENAGVEKSYSCGLRTLAPQCGHVSNFCGPVDTVIEPVDAYCFQNDRGGPLTVSIPGTQSGHVSNSGPTVPVRLSCAPLSALSAFRPFYHQLLTVRSTESSSRLENWLILTPQSLRR